MAPLTPQVLQAVHHLPAAGLDLPARPGGRQVSKQLTGLVWEVYVCLQVWPCDAFHQGLLQGEAAVRAAGDPVSQSAPCETLSPESVIRETCEK